MGSSVVSGPLNAAGLIMLAGQWLDTLSVDEFLAMHRREDWSDEYLAEIREELVKRYVEGEKRPRFAPEDL